MSKALSVLRLAIIIVMFSFIQVQSADLYVVAVFDLKPDQGISDQEARFFSDLFRKELVATRKLKVLDRNKMKDVAEANGYNLDACTEEGCAVEIGKILNSDKLIVGRIGKLGGQKYYLYSEMIDQETGLTLYGADVYCSNRIDEIPGYIPELAIKLSDQIKLHGKVMEVNANEVLVNLGTDIGIETGTILIVDRRGEAIRDPSTNEEKGYNWTEVARLQVIDRSGSEFSKCQILSTILTIKTGDRVTESESGGVIEAKGEIVFRIEPGDVFLIKDGSPSGTIPVPENGQLTMELPPGAHTISFSRSGKQDWQTEVVIRAGETKQIEVDFRSGQSSLMEASGKGIIVISSEPTGARVLLDGVERGFTACTISDVAAGSHTVEIQKSLYKRYAESVIVESDKVTDITKILEPDFGRLSISSNPSGAMVFIDGQQKGLTTYEVERFQSGEYDLRLVKQLYHESTRKFTVQSGRPTNLPISLRPAFGSLQITSNPSGARVTVDEQYWGRTPVQKDTVLSGQHRVLIQQELFNDYEQVVTVNDGQPASVNAMLNKNFGTIDITSDPLGADVFIAGQAGKFGTTPVKRNLQPGSYRVHIQKDLYETYEQTVNLRIGDVQKLSPKLLPKSGRLVIITDPPYADIYLNGKNIGKKSPIIEDKPIGTYKVLLKMPKHADYHKTVEVKYKKEARIDIRMPTTAYNEKMKRKKQAIVMSTFLPGSGQLRSRQTIKGLLYMAVFAEACWLTYDYYLQYDKAKESYWSSRSNYLNASYQPSIDSYYNQSIIALGKMQDYDEKHRMYAMITGGIWAWNLIDVLIWGGGKAETFAETGDENPQLAVFTLPDRVGISISF